MLSTKLKKLLVWYSNHLKVNRLMMTTLRPLQLPYNLYTYFMFIR